MFATGILSKGRMVLGLLSKTFELEGETMRKQEFNFSD